MPTNVSYEYANAQKKYDKARTPLEKLVALQEMKSTAPSHKGAEHLRAEISRKIADIKRSMDKQKAQAKKTSGGKSAEFNVKKEGSGQIVLAGIPNCGKSTILKALTNVNVEVTNYPFATKKPFPGMIDFSGTRIQLVELPGIIENSSQGKANGMIILSTVRTADAIITIVNSVEEQELLEREFRGANIIVNRRKPKIFIKISQFKGINITGKRFLKEDYDNFCDFLKNLGMYNVSVVLQEDTTFDKVGEVLDDKLVYKKILVLAKNEKTRIALEKKGYKAILFKKDFDVQKMKKHFFRLLNKILVYTKRPGEDADYTEPLVLKNGATVEQAAKHLHKDFSVKLKHVKVWGSTKFAAQRVSKHYKLKDKDIIEFGI